VNKEQSLHLFEIHWGKTVVNRRLSTIAHKFAAAVSPIPYFAVGGILFTQLLIVDRKKSLYPFGNHWGRTVADCRRFAEVKRFSFSGAIIFNV